MLTSMYARPLLPALGAVGVAPVCTVSTLIQLNADLFSSSSFGYLTTTLVPRYPLPLHRLVFTYSAGIYNKASWVIDMRKVMVIAQDWHLNFAKALVTECRAE